MKNMNKLISMLLVVCVLASMLSVSAFAAGDILPAPEGADPALGNIQPVVGDPAADPGVPAVDPSLIAPAADLSLAAAGVVQGVNLAASASSVKDNENVIFTVALVGTGDLSNINVELFVDGVFRNNKLTEANGAVKFTYAASNLGVGTHSVVAKYPTGNGSETINSAEVTVVVSQYIAPSMTLNAYELSLNGINASGSVEATILPAEYASQGINWSIVSGDCVSIAPHPTKANSVTVTALQSGSAIVQGVSRADSSLVQQFTVYVTVPVTDITLSPASLSMSVGDPAVTVNAILTPTNPSDATVTWTGGNSAVVTMTPNGASASFAPVAAGNATVYVTSGSITRELHITVVDNTQPSIIINEGNTVSMVQGESKSFTATVSNASFTRWLIEQNGNYATLSNYQNMNTVLTAQSPTNLGPIKLIAQARANNGTYVEAYCYITINTADILALQANPQNITTGYTSTVSAANPLSGERFNWQYQLSAANVAIVNSHNDGEYVTVQAGSVDGYVTLTATSKTNANRTAQIVVYVNTTAPHGSATIYPTSATWTRGNGNLSFQVNPGVHWAYLDNTLLNNLGTNYATYYNGVLTLKSAYLSTLSSGSHTLKVYTTSANNTSGQPDGLVYANIYINGSASNYGDSVHVKGSGYNLYFTATDPVRNVYISNTWIDPSNYTLDATGKQLTLHANFLNQLSYGNYTMRLETSNGSSQTATFRIVAANYAPATGDNNNIFLWVAVLAISGAGVIALIPKKKHQM